MEENKGIEMGVEVEGVANLEPEVVAQPEATQEVVEETVDTQQEEVTESEPVETKFEKAFSKRLSKATEKVREEVKGEYELQLEKFRKVIELGVKENGFNSIDEYIEAVMADFQDEPTDSKSPLDPESLAILEELKEQKTAKEFENEKRIYWDRQAKLLKDIGVTDMSQIPEEVLEKALDNDTEIAYEYLKWDKQQAIKNAKKEVIREIQETETPGSLTGGGSDSTDISGLAWDDPKFDEILRQVKSGERKRL